jgi:hypothetical protein
MTNLVEQLRSLKQHVAEDAADELERLQRENATLRGIATKIMPCHYCGSKTIADCPYGFPGCSLADDAFLCDDTANAECRDLRAKLAAVTDQAERAVAGCEQLRAELETRRKPEGYALVVHPDHTELIQSLPEGQWVILQRKVLT